MQNPNHCPRVVIYGLGQMGLVCAQLLSAATQNGGPRAEVVGWGHDQMEIARLAQTRRSDRLPEFLLAESVRIALRPEDAFADADLVICAVPVQFIREAFMGVARLIPRGAGVVSVAKGIENETLLRPTQILADCLGDDPDAPARRYAALSGPTIASELARCLPATMIAASDDDNFACDIQRLFSTSWLRVYTNDDLPGVELSGAMKNVVAIAAGILDGLQAGYNAKSALLARGLAEIARLGGAMGAQDRTFAGIAGVGDLATSCFSPEGRNRSCGEALGRGILLEDYLRSTRHVVEGVATTRSVVDLARKYNVEVPIAEAVHAVLFDGLDPIEGISRLMSRELRSERSGK